MTVVRRATGGCASFPRREYEIIDTWYAMGMVGTGSKDIAVTDLFVPARRALPLVRCRGGLTHPGATLNSGPLYRIPILAPSGHPLGAAAIGTAQGALDLFLESIATRAGTYTGAKVAELPGRPGQGGTRSLLDRRRTGAPA